MTNQVGVDRLGASMRGEIDAIFADWDRSDSPGVALGIYRDGDLLYTRGYGMANLEHGVPIVPDSVFHLASVSKEFAGFAIALLWSEGRLDIDADVRQWVPEVPSFGGVTITLRHLMHHTSGLRDQWSLLALAGWRQEDLVTERDVLDLLSRQTDLNFPPGEQYAYCNTGYTLMAVIVERVTGQSLRAFCQERIFAPLGMTRTHFHDDHSEIVPGRTQAYLPRDGGGYRISIPEFDVVGATSLFSTVEDFVHWDRHFTTLSLTTPEVMAAFLEPATTTNGTETQYGWGIAIEDYRGVRIVGHSGADHGYRSHFAHLDEHGLGVAVFANLSTIAPSVLVHRVIDVLLADVLESEATGDDIASSSAAPSDLTGFTGIYRGAANHSVLIVAEQDGALVSGKAKPVSLTWTAGTTFVFEPYPWLSVTFDEGIATLAYSTTTTPLTRVADGPRPWDDVDCFLGAYTSAELGVTWEIVANGDGLVLRRRKIADTAVLLIDDDLAVIEGDFGASELAFDADGFRYSTDRMRGLRFDRS